MTEDDWREHLADRLRRQLEISAPRDVVRGPGVTRESLKEANDRTGTWSAARTPAEVVFDVDGIPAGVVEGEPVATFRGPTFISEADVARLQITDEELAPGGIFERIRVMGRTHHG